MTRIIDIKEVAAWLEARGLLGLKRLELVEEVDHSRLLAVRSFSIPTPVAKRLVYGEALANFFAEEEEVLLYVDDWAGSYQDMNLFDRFRQGLGETAKVGEKPGHLFYPDDQADLLSLLRVVMSFDWAEYLISSSGDLLLEINHDNVGWLYAADPRKVDKERLEWIDQLAEAHQGTNTDFPLYKEEQRD